jgi:hypothetical protein
MTDYTKPPVQPAWAESGDRSDPPSNPELQEGWALTNTPPTRQRFNWILNWLANGVRYFMQRGLPDWDAAESYREGSLVIGPDMQTYRGLRSNTGANPTSSPLDWVGWPDTSAIEAEVDAANAAAASAVGTANAASAAAGAAQTTANAALPKAGGTMTGSITLSGDPTANLHATPRQYVTLSVGSACRVYGLIVRTGGSATQLVVSHTGGKMRNAAGETKSVSALSSTTMNLNDAQAGPVLNKRDQAGNFAGQWTYVYEIGGAGQPDGLILSASAIAPNLPAGYTWWVRCCPIRIGGTANSVFTFFIDGDRTHYTYGTAEVCGPSTTNPPGNTESGLSVLLVAYVPPEAIDYDLSGYMAVAGSLSISIATAELRYSVGGFIMRAGTFNINTGATGNPSPTHPLVFSNLPVSSRTGATIKATVGSGTTAGTLALYVNTFRFDPFTV